MSTTKQGTRCESCDRPIDTATTHLSFEHNGDALVCTYTCRPCGHVHERAMTDADVDRFLDHMYRSHAQQDSTR